MPRIVTLLAAAALAATPLAGCGADDVNPDALAEAADATRARGGVHLTMDSTIRAGGQTIPMKAEGDADLRNSRLRMTTEGGNGLPSVETVMLGTVMYMKMAGFEKALGSEWVKFDMAKVGEELGIDFEQFLQMGQASPAEQLKYLRAMADLEEVGTETVDGVETTHYKGVVDMRRYPDTVPAAEREEARRAVEKLVELSGDATTPTEVWIDEDSLVRRQKMTLKQKKPQELTTEMDIRYTDFGKRVEVEAPEDAKDVTELATQGVREQSGG
jgi:hypothetical protein